MLYDIITVGAGPAGLTAAVYARRSGKTVLMIEKETFGGQITFSPKVENIPGFQTVSGTEFADLFVTQALSLGADTELDEVEKIEVLSSEEAENLFPGEFLSTVTVKKVTTSFSEFYAKAVIIATGAKHRLLGLPNEENFIGNGISFCAVCDGAFYKDMTVGIIGGGNSALQEAVLLSSLVKKLYVFQDLPFLTGEKLLQNELLKKDNVTVFTSTSVLEILGEKEFEGIKVLHKEENREEVFRFDGLFIAIGLVPQNTPFEALIDLDQRGYAVAGEDCMTKTPGVYIAGDARTKGVRQVTTASSDGAVACLKAIAYIEGR